MYLDNVGTLTVLNGFLANRNGSPATKYLRIYDDELFAWDAGAVAPLKIQRAGGVTTFLGPVTLAGAPTVDLHAATKKYADDGDAVALFSANSYTNARVLKAGDTMTGVLDIDLPSGTTPLIVRSATGISNYVPFYQGTTRRGYVGVFPADGSRFNIYSDTSEIFIRSDTGLPIIFAGGGSETMRVGTTNIFLGKTTTAIGDTGVYITSTGQFVGTTATNVDGVVSNATSAAVVTGHDFFSARNDNTVARHDPRHGRRRGLQPDLRLPTEERAR